MNIKCLGRLRERHDPAERRRAGADLGRRGQDRRDERPVRPVCRSRRAGLGRGGAHGGRGLRRQRQWRADRGALRRPPEQARRRLQHRARVDRRPGRRRDRGRADLVGRARGDRDRQGEGSRVPGLGRGDHRADRRRLLPEHHPLDLRHLRARGRHRPRHGPGGRRSAGSSSPPTTRSAISSRRTRQRWSRRRAARCSARCAIR